MPIRTESFFNWSSVITKWYSSGHSYDYNTGDGGGRHMGDFFPIVWDTTTHVGCGYNPSCSNALPTGALHLTAACHFAPPPEGPSTAHVFPTAATSSCRQHPTCAPASSSVAIAAGDSSVVGLSVPDASDAQDEDEVPVAAYAAPAAIGGILLVLLLLCCLTRRARQRKRADTSLVSGPSPNLPSLLAESASPLAVRVRVDADDKADETPLAGLTNPLSAHGTVYEAQYADLGRLSG